MALKVKFWGVRGSIACASPDHIRYGGNTSCLEIFAGDHRFIFDAGTGIRTLGQEFFKADVKNISLLLTHTHWDHINGFPFFGPAYDPNRSVRIMAGHLLKNASRIQEVLSTQMDNPMFPVPLETMRSKLTFEDFNAGETFELFPGVKIRTAPLNHPNDATGYRVEHGGKAIVYVTDTEHVPGKPDQNILGLIEGADLVVYDSTYTEQEFPARVGWGHSTWNEGVKLCQAAKAKRLGIFHHDPDHNDEFMDKLAADAKAAWSQTVVVREGMEIEV